MTRLLTILEYLHFSVRSFFYLDLFSGRHIDVDGASRQQTLVFAMKRCQSNAYAIGRGCGLFLGDRSQHHSFSWHIYFLTFLAVP